MAKPLTIVAIIQAKAGHEAEVETSLRGLIAPTRKEAGCLNYDLHRDHQVAGRFLFHENWASKPLWEAHMESAHLKAHQAATAGLVTDFQLLQMEPVNP